MSTFTWISVAIVFAATLFSVQGMNIVEKLRPPLRTPLQPEFSRNGPAHRLRRVAMDSRSFSRVLHPPPVATQPSHSSSRYQGPIKRQGPPYVFIQPMAASKRPRSRSSRRLVLTLPEDNIQILNAEAVSDRGSQFMPTTLTLSLRDPDEDDSNSGGSIRFGGTTRTYASQIPSPPRQSSRYQYGFMPMTPSEEDKPSGRKSGNWGKGEVSYDFEDLVGSSGGHVTFIKAQKANAPKTLRARKVSSGSSYKPMKAILIEPKQIEAKRVRLLETNTEKVSPTKARLVKSSAAIGTTVVKSKTHPLLFKQSTAVKDEDWAASSLHYVKAKPPPEAATRHQNEDLPPMELQCGGTNDLGWCDLGSNYPSSEVSQIMEVCEELVSRMFVEIPEDTHVMEDIVSYSLSRNISEQGPRAFWPWKEASTLYKRPLCDVDRDMIRPSFAQDVRGKWHVIIQTDSLPQRIALEVCKSAGEPCRSSELCSGVKSQCVQKYSHHQLISFDPESAETCPYVRLYKFPTSCVCRTAH